MAAKVSIIIPIFNSADKIGRLLDSIICQTLDKLEIICVLDCPTDGTDIIVHKYANLDNRITIISNTTNLGVAASRNKGLKVCTGEYIGFADHDDFIVDNSFYEVLYNEAKKQNADICLSNALINYQGEIIEKWKFDDISQRSLINCNILPMLPLINKQMGSHCIWHSLFKNEFIRKHNIEFRDRSEILDEDRLFNFECYINTTKIAYVNRAFYSYCQYPNSVSNLHRFNYASRQITRTMFYIKSLRDSHLYNAYKPALRTLVCAELFTYFPDYTHLTKSEHRNLGFISHSLSLPLLIPHFYSRKYFTKKTIQINFILFMSKALYLFS